MWSDEGPFSFGRRTLLRLAGLAAAERLAGFPKAHAEHDAHRVVLITLGGIRREESFSEQGVVYIPNLFQRLLPQTLFYPYVVNEGVTAHVNTISALTCWPFGRVSLPGKSVTPREVPVI